MNSSQLMIASPIWTEKAFFLTILVVVVGGKSTNGDEIHHN
jgi:hypothetical protein